MAHTGFFYNALAKQENKRVSEYSCIPVGGEQFHALAVALIDCFKNATRINEASVKKILERLYSYYPKLVSTQPYLTPADRMGLLVNSSRKSEVVECLAYVLRQLVVDELYANPLNYREAFAGLSCDTLSSYLRQSNTILPVSALRALTEVLGMNITLIFTEHGKELRGREIYSSSLTNVPKFEVSIQVQGNEYFPLVKNKADFVYVGQLAITPLKPIDNVINQTSTIAEVLELIKSDNKHIKHAYDQTRKSLMSMVDTGELTKEKLITYYIEFLPQNYMAHISTTAFFAGLEQLDKYPVVVPNSKDSKHQVAKLLVDALAGWISTKQLDADQLFDRIDSKSVRTTSTSGQ